MTRVSGRTNPAAAPRASRFHRIRYRFGGALLLGAALPFLLFTFLLSHKAAQVSADTTLYAVVFAIAGGEYLLRAISAYPGVRAQIFAAPILLATYGIVVAGLVMARIEYNRLFLLSSLILTVVWYVAVLASARRTQQLRFGVVPFGDATALNEIPGVEWRMLGAKPDTIGNVDGVVADLRSDLSAEWERQLAQHTLDGKNVYHSKQLREALTGRVKIDHLSENTFGSLTPIAAYLRVKLLIDVLGAVVALPLVLLLLLVFWAPVRLGSPGPLIYRQQRVGYRGRIFTVYKIRTMAERPSEPGDSRDEAMTRDGDPRVTPLGRILRRTRIDELPQVFNILRGEMSWIGPRPEAAALSAWYEREIPFYVYRHVVRPGITGWAQVNQGHVAEVHEVSEKLENDFYYIKYFSPWLDLLIVFRTIGIVFTGFGAR